MEIVDFDTNTPVVPELTWRDLTAQQVQTIAHAENDVLDEERALRYGTEATHLTADGRNKLADEGIADHNERAAKFLSRMAILRGTNPDTSYEPLRTGPEAELYEAMPLWFSPGMQEMNWHKRLRYATPDKRLDHKHLSQLEVARATKLSVGYISRIEHEERTPLPERVDQILSYISAMNDLNDVAKLELYRRHNEQLGNLALPELAKMAHIEWPIAEAA